MRKTIYTVAVDNYAPEITALTFPLMRTFAHKIGADFHVIENRKFPDWPATMEKLQIAELGKENKDDWSIFFDADALVHPETFDFTEHLSKDTVLHHALDRSTVRYTPDIYYRRDGRFQSPGNWFTVGSDWCRDDLWAFPADDPRAIIKHIHPTVAEHNGGVDRAHLIDDFIIGRNVARFGLKRTTFVELCEKLDVQPIYFFHLYAIPREVKLVRLKEKLAQWGL